MSFLLSAFFLIYACIHLYCFLRARAVLHHFTGAQAVLAVFMLLMITAPLIVRLLEREGYELSATVLSQIGYNWMGLIFLFFVLSILFDLYHSVVLGAGLLFRADVSFMQLSARQLFFIPLVAASVIFIHSYFDALMIRTERITIASEKIPDRIGSLKIVQISDVHIGLMNGEMRLKRILDKVKKAEPDLLVSTGDLLDGQMNRIDKPAALLREIRPRYGKFAIMGNHEYYSGFPRAVQFFRDSGFTLLRGERTGVGDFLNLVGFDDPAGRSFGVYRGLSKQDLDAKLRPQHFNILLRHRPAVNHNQAAFDLQLSGHTHKGQIFPFNFIIRMVFPMDGGLFALPGGAKLYVNRGAGTWGPPIRFLAPPEITVIELRKTGDGHQALGVREKTLGDRS